MTTGLTARLRLARNGFTLDADLAVAPGEVVALLGRNGAGKSTLLASLAGLLPLDAGRIALGATVLDDGNRRFVPPERRPVGLVLQQAALFPHLDVRDNVAFGLRTAGMRRAAARRAASAELARHDLSDLAARAVGTLSGGQAARVALVRALIRRPALLLLDEPLAAIDASARPELRSRLAADLAVHEGAAVLVTHDVRDAEALATRVLVIEAGTVLQEGTVTHLRRTPASDVVARLLADQTSSTSSGASA